MEEELNSDARELIRAARIPPTTIPVKPLGNKSFTRVEKAASLESEFQQIDSADSLSFEQAQKLGFVPGGENNNS